MELTILLTPNFNTTLRKLGYEPYDDYNTYSVQFQQGADIQRLLIEPGDSFEITDFWESAMLYCDGNLIRFIDLKDEDEFIKEDDSNIQESDDSIDLSPGHYKYYDDGKTIEKIKELDTNMWDDTVF